LFLTGVASTDWVIQMNKKRVVSLLVFDDVEVLDFAGPFEVFSVTNELSDYSLFDIQTVSPRGDTIRARNGLSVNPDCPTDAVDRTDLLIVPGGDGTRPLLEQDDVITWIRNLAADAERVLSVCTGALLLARAGLLQGKRATTHHQAFDELEALTTDTELVRDTRFVDNGQIVTAAGVSAGIDMSLHIVEQLYGRDTADTTARYMEYHRR
jgi:transcriptional regulator GlxA family with amidase domain